LSARVEYGFYAEEPRVIEAAAAALERLPEDAPGVRYNRALAAYRSAQLRPREDKRFADALDDCLELSPTEDANDDAEPWILVAACASLGVERGSSQQRRRDEALARARGIDEDNPRIAFLEASLLVSGLSGAPYGAAPEVAAALTRAAEAFRAWDGGYMGPTWGEAETLVLLGEVHLQRGETRVARDLLERALLIAPDYRAALNLRARLQRAP
jgi:tetratricopeptide (TPR) repeat protein